MIHENVCKSLYLLTKNPREHDKIKLEGKVATLERGANKGEQYSHHLNLRFSGIPEMVDSATTDQILLIINNNMDIHTTDRKDSLPQTKNGQKLKIQRNRIIRFTSKNV